jgi:hypothetical protein
MAIKKTELYTSLKDNDIGDKIKKKILKPMFSAKSLEGTLELVDFNLA